MARLQRKDAWVCRLTRHTKSTVRSFAKQMRCRTTNEVYKAARAGSFNQSAGLLQTVQKYMV